MERRAHLTPLLARTWRAVALVGVVLLASTGMAEANTDVVANNHESGGGSLRQTIANAIAGDTVVIPANVGQITLTSGQIPIDKNLTIQGAGASSTTISGNDASRIFCIQAPACPAGPSGTQPAVSISAATLEHGNVTVASSIDGGGAIYASAGALTLSGVVLTNNSATNTSGCCGGGGAVFSTGTLTISNSTVGPNNSASSPGCCGGGGGIYDYGGTVSVANSHIDGNSALATSGCCGGGGGLYASSGSVSLTNTSVDNNHMNAIGGCCEGGGGVYGYLGGVTLSSSHADGNTLTADGGCCGGGGGVYGDAGPVTLSSSDADNNSAAVNPEGGSFAGGGGIYAYLAASMLTRSTLAGNSLSLAGAGGCCGGGGGLYQEGGGWSLSQSTIGPSNSATLADTGGVSGGGGAVYDDAGSTGQSVSNSTIAQNSLTVSAPGANDGGAGVYNNGSTGTFTGSTIAANTPSAAPGAGFFGKASGKAYTFKNTIIANSASGAQNCAVASGVTGAFASAGYNLEDANTCGLGAAGDRINTNPLLNPLATNGGPAETMALRPNSPAIDAGKAFGLTTDERGDLRPFDFQAVPNALGGDGSDIGAFELQPGCTGQPSPLISCTPSISKVRQSARVWRRRNKSVQISRKRKRHVGTVFSFKLNEQARVTFTFARIVGKGRRVHGKCVAPTRKNAHRRRCVRTRTAGTLSLTGHAGTNKVHFYGRLPSGKHLEPGRYTLTVTAVNFAHRRARSRKLTFTILK